jgi:carbon monoxide dehydrogenase subunit G
MTTKVDKSIEVNLPVRTVYNQWTQFEDFPQFMNGVTSVTQLGDDRMQWVAEIAGVKRQWEARVLEQVPDQKVSWAATGGATNAGQVTFDDLGGRTRVHLFLEYEPEGLVEKVGDKLNVVENQAEGDLDRFKAFVEAEGYATGAWRGTVPGTGHVGTPGVEDAAESRGDAGKAGVSGKAVAAGVGAAAAAAAGIAAVAAAGAKKHADETDVAAVDVPPTGALGTEPVSTSFDATETPATPVTSVDPVNPAPVAPGEAAVVTESVYPDEGAAGRTGV